ncbi:class I SAM-dependent methyltransferase [Nocardioides anomalus]|uniref:Class I SAM-dependent methyltransferase n=1 Tax=Nocardioides anomalus TaxID=2712223 RepID=A0A6G6WA42_9ACTN|nr:class I SAM-dependent methyltransferase [Nocardioides anomalus]QIG42208.1 class I SAM-dependent methyltransferase [Nocardioides anomalus]
MAFYADAALYDRLFPGGDEAVAHYRAAADRAGGSVLELGSGTGRKLLPLAADDHPCTGLELAPAMLERARHAAADRGLTVDWVAGDMRAFDLARTFDLVFSSGNSLLHLLETADLLSCLRAVRRHLAPGGRFVFDVFNPHPRLLAAADGARRTRADLGFDDPDRGPVTVDVAETYDAAAQVTRGTWSFSSADERDFLVVPLALRSVFPQELPLLLAAAGLRLVERLGDWSGTPFTGAAALQLCVCEAD